MNPPQGRCLGVFGLSLYTTESDLREVFSRYGRLDKVNVVIDQKVGTCGLYQWCSSAKFMIISIAKCKELNACLMSNNESFT